MSLKDRVSDEIKAAMKARDKIRLETLRSIKKVIIEKESEVRPKGQDALTPEQDIEVVTQLAKQRKDSIEQFQKAGRDDLVANEQKELSVLEKYLSEQMTEEDIKKLVQASIAELGAASMKDMGKVMQAVTAKTQGTADNKL
ncbi:MAG: GatB/YqeY domain-containing protein, partial [Cyanobacteria bacterium P01_F01_bin.4]